MLSAPLENFQEQVADLQEATASIERVEELLQLRPQAQEKASTTLPTDKVSVEFRDVSFSYDQQQLVLQNVSFHLRAGKVLGILGRTGSGKTTLARLLFRLYDPATGTISLNRANIRDVARDDLRDHVGMVAQDVQLFQQVCAIILPFLSRVSSPTVRGPIPSFACFTFCFCTAGDSRFD
jgi:ATP-binding cassette, subfamily B, bacterial